MLIWHESGHAVVAQLLYGAVAGVRLDSGGGTVWFGDPPPEDDKDASQQAAREQFSDTENMLHDCGPMPFRLITENFAKWRNNAVVALAGPECERLQFGLTLLPPSSTDLLSAKMFTRRLSVSRGGANALLESCRLEARAILQRYWRACEAIARELDREDEIDGETVAKLIAQNPPLLR
jgi:hypothetical protein